MGLRFGASAMGKLLLFGEHAAVRGYPALGLSLGFRLSALLEPSDRVGWTLPGLGREEARLAGEVLSILGQALPDSPSGGVATISGDLPIGLGFGSSAALCVALALALIDAPERALVAEGVEEARPPGPTDARHGEAAAGTGAAVWPSERELRAWRAAHRAERLFHGTPSGIDTGLALLGGCVRFDMRPPEVPLATRLPDPGLPLVAGAVPRESSAATLVGRVSTAAGAGDSGTLEALARLGSIAQEAARALADCGASLGGGLCERLGALADAAERELARLGLESPAQRAILEAGRASGALGGKLSGAGSGGAYWLIFPDRETAQSALAPLCALAQTIPDSLPPFLLP